VTQRCGFGNGKVLARLAAQYDCKQIGKGRLTSDALVATSTGRLRLTVITANMRDFSKLAEFRPFHWRVENPHASQLGAPSVLISRPQETGPGGNIEAFDAFACDLGRTM